MKTIIAGSRTVDNHRIVEAAILGSGFDVTEVVSGAQHGRDVKTGKDLGADYYGEVWATCNGVSLKRFPADWNQHGKAAGPIRNDAMTDYADALIAVWDGQSRGTRDVIRKANRKGLKVYVWTIRR